ncbi:hypothetical protein P4493_28710 [Bacillus thuringiensis]|jgi:hypothetical protein|uniref:Uncharacterized protein n=1 Tax=Bacillus thuringiensis subsp. israelensis TaxID=1430 RepID=A0AAX3HUV6_BACTI|nr:MULTISPECIES: hypothetical protein [Bacillus]MED1155380.1 hypothetical protein [Bacillus paranthracis]AJH06032.1 hypothetical protein AS86_5237 [Bacillus thuringiensis HD1002]EEM99667.1 hypothetical protein bthur0014_56650 [Bacillus thuringiensis IBL 4222]MEB4832696.1 hypothetical protein [Bacillus thuringiensis]MEC2373313.1 hypothetical protein [Bacillus thuringiensis]
MMYTSVLKRDLSYSDALNTLMVGKEGIRANTLYQRDMLANDWMI